MVVYCQIDPPTWERSVWWVVHDARNRTEAAESGLERARMDGNCSGPLRVASTTCTVDARTVGNSTPRSHS